MGQITATTERVIDAPVAAVRAALEPVEAGRSRVRTITTWNGASGIGGFFERTFAPKGLARIYNGVLANLAGVVRG